MVYSPIDVKRIYVFTSINSNGNCMHKSLQCDSGRGQCVCVCVCNKNIVGQVSCINSKTFTFSFSHDLMFDIVG